MSRPGEPGGGTGVDGDDGTFSYACFVIENLYGDLLGIESLSHAIMNSWVAGQLGPGHQPPIGINAGGPSFPVDYTIPATTPYDVSPRITTDGQDDQTRAQMTHYFNLGKSQAAGTADYLKAVMCNIYGTDPAWLGSSADDQLQALTHLHGQLIDDFAHIGPLLDDHFKGSTAEQFRSYYNQVDDVVNELVDYAGVAQLAAAGTANVLSVAKQSMGQAAAKAQKAFEDAFDAWKDDARFFPIWPGLAEKAMDEFTGLVEKVESYASLVPGPVGAASDAAQKGQQVVGAVSHLFGVGEPTEVKTPPTASDLYQHTSQTFTAQAKDCASALTKLGLKTTPKKNEVLSRPFLSLPIDKPDLHYT